MTIFSIPLPFQKVYRLSTIYPCDFVFPLTFLTWLIYALIKRQELKGKELFLSFLPFIAAGVISGINARDIFRLTGYIYLWLQIPLAYIMTVNIIRNRRYLNIVLYSSLITVVLFSCFYIFYVLRFCQFFIYCGKNGYFDRNIIASYIGLAPPLFLGLFFFQARLNQRILLLVLMLISLLGSLFTASQWGNFSLFLSLFVFIFFFVRNEDIPIAKNILLFVIILSLVSFIYMYFFNQVIYNELFNPRLDSLRARLGLYRFAFGLFKQHPIIGIGIGNFRNYQEVVHAHNMFMELLAEIGLVGIGAFVFLLRSLIRYLIRAVRACQGKDKYIIYGAIVSLLCFFLNNILDFTLGHGIGIQVGVILAIINSVYFQCKADTLYEAKS